MQNKITALEQKELVDALDLVRAFVENLETEKSCLSCLNLKHDKCTLAGRTPPDHVLKKGCDSWVIFDEIPYL